MDWGKLTRKLSILSLALGVTISTAPGISAARAVQPQITKSTLSLNHNLPATFISPQINTDSTEDIRVIVQLSGQPAAVGKYAAKQGISSLSTTATEAAVNSQQTDVLNQAADEGLDLQVNYKYNTVLNGFEITIPANEIPELAKISGVKSIYKNSTWRPIPVEQAGTAALETVPQNDNAPLKQIHADWAWAHNWTGTGLKVGVIDTGLDYTHPDIAPAYKGGYDSFYKDSDPYEEVPLTKAEDPYHVGYEGTYHGTHVAGTIVGQFANKTGDIAQKGVAYGADLYAYKVLGRNLEDPSTSSGSSAQVIDGIERAVKDHMDVINLSLGADEEKDVNSPDAIAINNAVLSGVVAVIANGNAGPGYSTLGSPATSQLGISVGAVTSPIKHFSGHFTPEFVGDSVTTVTYSTYGDVQVMAWETGQEDFTTLIGTDPLDVVYVGLGSDEDYENKDVDGKIAFISRGGLTFNEKIANAKDHGAKAIVIFNGNVAKNGEPDLSDDIPNRNGFYGILGDSYEFIPTLDLKGTEGRILARAILANPDTKLQFTFNAHYNFEYLTGDGLSTFTSWGPNVDKDFSIKPDIVAPGVSILSTWPAYGKYKEGASYAKAYSRISGTSMATPHVAGLALLIKQAHPEWSPLDIRSALANTADVVGDDEGIYDVFQQGAGRVNVENAILTQALLQSLEPITILDKNYSPQNVINYNSSASFGLVAPGASAVKNLQLKNTGKEALTYTASVEWHYEVPKTLTATLDKNSVTAEAGKSTAFALNLNVGTDAKEGRYEGQINLSAAGQPDLHLPFSVFVGGELEGILGIQEVSVTNPLIFPNRDSQASTDLTFRLVAEDTNAYEIDLINLEDELIGYIDSRITDSADTFFKPGRYTAKGINGTYHPIDDKGKPVLDEKGEPAVAHLKDGTYKIKIAAAQLTATGEVATDKYDNEILYSAFTSIRVDNSAASSSGGSGGGSGGGSPAPATGNTTTKPAVNSTVTAVIEQGYQQAPVNVQTTSKDGVTLITVSDSDLKNALASAAAGSKIAAVLSVSSISDPAAKVSLTADQLKQLAAIQPQSTVIISVGGSAVSLPVALLKDIPAGSGLEVTIRKADDQQSKFTAALAGSKVIGTPVSFEASYTSATGSTALKVPSDVFIKRSFTIPGSIEPNTAGVLFEENGKFTPVSSVFKKQQDGSTIVTVSRPGFSGYAAVSRPITFNDIASSPAAADIQALANKLIIEGTSANTFSPKSNLTRAEFTALLTRALGLRASSAATFNDVKATDWFASDVAAAFEAGLIQGIGKGKFAPNDKVNRQELAVILGRALKLTGVELQAASPSFSTYADDAKIAKFAKESVQSLSAAGVISSDSGSNFNPTAAATREAVAAGLHQLLIKAKLID